MNKIYKQWVVAVAMVFCASTLVMAGKQHETFLIPSEGKINDITYVDPEKLEHWKSTGNISWEINFEQEFKGYFYLLYSAAKGEGGKAALFIDGTRVMDLDIKETGAWWKKSVASFGKIPVVPGKHTVEIKTLSVNKSKLMNLYAGLITSRKKINSAMWFPEFPMHKPANFDQDTFPKTAVYLMENGFGSTQRIRTGTMRAMWNYYPIQMAWLTQDAVDQEKARMNSEYDVANDISALFGKERSSELEQKMIKIVLDEIGDEASSLDAELNNLVETNTSVTDLRWLELYERACKMRRCIRLEPLLAKTNEIVFAKHQVFGSKTGILYITETEGTDHVSELSTIDLAGERNGEFAKVSTLFDTNGGMARDPNISFDGKRMLFAWRKTRMNQKGASEPGNYQIYEMDLATKEVRQLTTDETYGANFEGIYLPNGDIMFSSARIVQHITCGWGDCSNLFLMDKDGNYQRRVGFDQTNTMSPAVTNDGRVLYLRRDYNDRGQSSAHGLFQMMPDGTGQTEYYGNQTGTPNSFQHPAAIPGANKIAIVLGGYHTRQGGQLAIMDVRNGRQNADGLIRLPQGDKPPTDPGHADGYAKKGIQYSNPYPLSETEFIVSRSETWGRKKAEHYRVFFMTADGRRELLASDPDTSCLQPVAVIPRQQPAVRPSMVNYKKKTGTMYVQNVYHGDAVKGVKPGSIKKLRVVELLYKPTTISAAMGKGPGGMWHTVTPTGHPLASFDSKRIIGEATVYDDGSAMFEVPARTPVYLQLLDGENRVVQTMRSWATLMPGEQFSCVGCHENKNDTPVMGGKMTQAMKRGVEKLAPFYGEPRAFSYLKEVQPVFDKYCTECHADGADAGKKLVLTAEPFVSEPPSGGQSTARTFAQSYVNLAAARPGQENISPEQFEVKSTIDKWKRSGPAKADEPNRYISYWTRFELMGPGKPYRAGSIKSGLIKKIEEGHVEDLPREALDKLKAWIDLNMVYAGEYDESNNWTPSQLQKYKDRVTERKRNEAIEAKAIAELIEAEK